MAAGDEDVKLLHEELKTATVELNAAVDAFTNSSGGASRQDIVSAAEKILLSARDPNGQWMDHALETGRIGATHVFHVWGGFAHVPVHGSILFTELAQKLDAEVSLVGESPFPVLSGMLPLTPLSRAHRRGLDLSGNSTSRRDGQRRAHAPVAHLPPRQPVWRPLPARVGQLNGVVLPPRGLL